MQASNPSEDVRRFRRFADRSVNAILKAERRVNRGFDHCVEPLAMTLPTKRGRPFSKRQCRAQTGFKKSLYARRSGPAGRQIRRVIAKGNRARQGWRRRDAEVSPWPNSAAGAPYQV